MAGFAYEDDNFDLIYTSEKLRQEKEREAEETERQLDSQRALIARRVALANEAQQQEDQGAQPKPQQPQGEPQEQDGEFFGGVGELGTQILGGLRDAGVNTAQTLIDFGGLMKSGIDLEEYVPGVSDPTSTVGSFARTTTQFLTAFIPALGALKAVKGVGMVSKAVNAARTTRLGKIATTGIGAEILTGATAGAAADFLVYDPQEARFSNLLKEWGVDNEVIGWLAADEYDSDLEGRAKNVIEGLGLGVVADSILLAFRAARGVRKAATEATLGDTPAGVVQAGKEAADSVITETTRLDVIDTAEANLDRVRRPQGDLDVADARDILDEIDEGLISEGGEAAQLGLKAAIRIGDEVISAGGERGHAGVLAELDIDGMDPSALDDALEGFVDAEGNFLTRQEAAAKAQREIHSADTPPNVQALIDGAEARAGASGRTVREEFEDLVKPMDDAANIDHPMGPGGLDRPSFVEGIEANARVSAEALAAERQDAEAKLQEALDVMQEILNAPGVPQEYREHLLWELEQHQSQLRPRTAKQLKELRENYDKLQLTPAEHEAREYLENRAKGRAKKQTKQSTVEEIEGSDTAELLDRVEASIDPTQKKPLKGFVDTANSTLMRAIDKALVEENPELAGKLIALQDNTNFDRIDSAEEFKAVHAAISEIVRRSPGDTARRQALQMTPLEKAEGWVGRSWDETMAKAIPYAERDALMNGFEGGPEVLLDHYAKFFQTTQDLDVHITALRIMESALVEDTRSIIKSIISDGGEIGDLTRAKYLQRRELLVQINDIRSGIATNMGRGLKAFGITIGGKGAGSEEVLRALREGITQVGGPDAIRLDALQLQAALDQGGAARRAVLQKSRKRLGLDMLVEYWMSAILSGPHTQAVNIISNTITSLWTTGESLLQGVVTLNPTMVKGALREYMGMFEGFRAALRMTAAGRRAFFSATGDAFINNVDKARGKLAGVGNDELGSAWRAFATDDPQLMADARQYEFGSEAFTAAHLRRMWGSGVTGPLAPDTFGQKLIDIVGSIERLPGRLLTTADEMAKTINYHMALSRLAYEEAIENGVTDVRGYIKKLQKEVPQMYSIPGLTDEQVQGYARLDSLAKKQARVRTFTDPLTQGSMSQSIQSAVARHPWARFVMPFVRTPVNLLKFTFQRTPLVNRMTQEFKEAHRDFLRGINPERYRAHQARVVMGYGLYTMAGYAAFQGKITGGGPRQPEERAALLATGWQPYSFRFVDEAGNAKYVGFNRADPYGLFLGLAADIGETSGLLEVREAEEIFAMATMALAKNLTAKSYFTGVTGLVDAINNPDRMMEGFIERFVGSFAPNLLAQTTRYGVLSNRDITMMHERDQVMHEVDGYLQAVQARLPGFSADLPPRRNVFGEIVTYPMGYGVDTLSPFYVRHSPDSLVNREYTRLVREAGFGIQMGSLYNSVRGVKLNAEQKDRFIVLSSMDLTRNGNTLRVEMDKLMQSRRYRQADDGPDGKQMLIRDLMQKHRTRAKRKLLKEYPELAEQIRQVRRERRLALYANRRQQAASALTSALGITPRQS